MRHFMTMPDTTTIIEAALATTMRPSGGMPSVISAGYQVVANVTRALRVDAGAVHYIPPGTSPTAPLSPES
jgi:hypothetical protein